MFYELMKKLSESGTYFTMVIKLNPGLQREHSINKIHSTPQKIWGSGSNKTTVTY
jgi:hypothetical protein